MPRTAPLPGEQEYARRLEAEAVRIPARLAELPQVRLVVGFGSFYGGGRRDLLTDLDFLVVMETSEPFLSRIEALLQWTQPLVATDILVYTPQEFQRLLQRGIVRQAITTGRILYEARSGR